MMGQIPKVNFLLRDAPESVVAMEFAAAIRTSAKIRSGLGNLPRAILSGKPVPGYRQRRSPWLSCVKILPKVFPVPEIKTAEATNRSLPSSLLTFN